MGPQLRIAAITAEAVLRAWLDEAIIPTVPHPTDAWYRLVIQAVLLPAIGDLPADRLTWPECRRRLRAIRRRRPRRSPGEGLSPWSEEAARLVLAEAAAWAAEHDLIPAGIEMPPGGDPGDRNRYHPDRPGPAGGGPGGVYQCSQ